MGGGSGRIGRGAFNESQDDELRLEASPDGTAYRWTMGWDRIRYRAVTIALPERLHEEGFVGIDSEYRISELVGDSGARLERSPLDAFQENRRR